MAAPDPPVAFDPDDLVRHTRFVKSLARELARDEAEADDLAARTLAEAVARQPGSGPSVRVWLRRVLWRIFRRERRDEQRRARHALTSAKLATNRGDDAAPATIDLVARIELEQTIAAAFAELEEPYKSTLFLRFYDDRSPSQITAQTGTPVETVKTRLKRGLAKLRARLDEKHDGRGEGGQHGGIGDWRAVALALAKQGGTGVAIAKTKSLVAAAVVVIVAGIATWELAPRAARRDSATAEARAPDPATATVHAPAPLHKDESGVAAQEAALRSADALPFASGIVVDEAGVGIAGVRVIPSLVARQSDGQWIATPLGMMSADHDALATTEADGRYQVAHSPRNLAGLFFFKPGFAAGEWFELAALHEQNQDHRVVLAPAARVHGRVVDTAGRPIAFASTDVFPGKTRSITFMAAAAEGQPKCVRVAPWSTHSSTTDADGRFTIESLNDVPCTLCVSAAGYGGSAVLRELTDRDTETEIVLHRLAAVLIDVRDAKTRAPVVHARAFSFDALGEHAVDLFLPYEEWLGREWDGKQKSAPGRLPIWLYGIRTNDSKHRGDTQSTKLVVFSDGYRPVERVLVVKLEDELPHEIVELEPREPVATLSGTVIGAPQAQLDLRFDPPHVSGFDTQNSPPIATLRVGADGRFAFHDLAPANYRLFASAKGLAPIWVDVTSPRDDLSLRFAPAASVIAHVVDHAGAPVAGEVVQLQSLDGHRAWSATSGDDGNARFEELPTGTFDVLAHPPFTRELADAPARTTESYMFLGDERITLIEGENGPLEIPSLERRPVSLRLSFSDGSAVADAKVSDLADLRGPVEWGDHEGTRLRALTLKTDSDGFVDVDLYPGDYALVVAAGGLKCRANFVVPRRGDAEIDVTIGNAHRVGALRGRVATTPGDRPIKGWIVGVFVPGQAWESSVRPAEVKTDDDGRFHLDSCPAGSVVVMARDPSEDWTDEAITSASIKLDLAPGATADVTIPIPRADGAAALATNRLDLTVTSAADGTPVPLVDVLVRGTIGGVDYSLISRSIQCDRDGHLAEPLFACERYHVSLYPPREAHEAPSKWQKLELDAVAEDGVVRVRAALPLATGK